MPFLFLTIEAFTQTPAMTQSKANRERDLLARHVNAK